MFKNDPPPSVLSHFEPVDLLDALSIGIVLLDAQLCVIYANGAAQDVLAFRVDEVRGRPFADFLGQSIDLVSRLRRVLETDECIAVREYPVRPLGSPDDASGLDVTITPLGSQVTGKHLLLEFGCHRETEHSPREGPGWYSPGAKASSHDHK